MGLSIKEQDFEPQELQHGAVDAANVLRALSNPSRLMLLCELVEAEKSVGELERALGMSQAYVSQQLARLRSDELVSVRRDGRSAYYSLADGRVKPLLAVLYEQFCKRSVTNN